MKMDPTAWQGRGLVRVAIVFLLLIGLSGLAVANPVEDVFPLVSGNSAFAFALYRQLSGTDASANLLFSPYSISAALAMAYAGARAETEIQMQDVLRFTLGQDRTHSAFQQLRQLLMTQDRFQDNADSDPFRLRVANSLWRQIDYAFLESYISTLQSFYGTDAFEADFAADCEDARQSINAWVSDQTEEKIPELIQPGALSPATVLVLANAVYFQAAWEFPFSEEETSKLPFVLADGQTCLTPMMQQTAHIHYANTSYGDIVELGYANSRTTMTLILPDDQMSLASFESSLSVEVFDEMLASLEYRPVTLTLPKFSYRAALSLSHTLAAMGMQAAFSDTADFSGMDGTYDLLISEVIHEAFIVVDEKGTEAAAATAVIMARGGLPETPRVVIFDRPFLFAIRDTETGTILFLGRVMDPSA